MLTLTSYDKEKNYRTFILRQNPEIFHRALRAVLNGEKRFHVENPAGENFDLIYEENDAYTRSRPEFHGIRSMESEIFFPSYLLYDETDEDRLLLQIFDPYERIYFDSINEYTIMLADILLRSTQKELFFQDSSIYWFLGEQTRLNITEDFPEQGGNGSMLVTDKYMHPKTFKDASTVWHLNLFHDVFFMQWLTDRKISEIKYIEVSLLRVEGIGSILVNLAKVSNLCATFGWKAYIRPGTTRYPDEMLNKYFTIFDIPEDANDMNTAYLCSFFPLVYAHPIQNASSYFGKSIFQESFLSHLEEYADAVLGDKKMLGILIRGTDYLKVMPFRSYTTEELIPILKERMATYGCEGIFLATEDQDRMDELREAFPGQVKVVAQERYRVSDLGSSFTISEAEKKRSSGEEYLYSLEDTTINYFYAIYMLSRCTGFISTPHTHGMDIVFALNGGRFEFQDVLVHFL